MNLFDLLSGEARPDTDTHKIYGVVIAIVTNNKDPDKLGRVKVRFPWLGNQDESQWARVATLMAGKSRGAFFLPEVDDEVLVAFEHGDVQFPYIIGALWNGKDTPPYDNADGKNTMRVFRSRSGHELIFNDDADGKKEQVAIKTNAGHQIVLDDTSGQEQISIKDKSGSNSILIDSTQNAINLVGDKQTSIKSGSNSILIDSAQNAISIDSQMKLSIKAQMIEIEAGATMTIKAGATLTIKGALVQIN